MRTECKGCGQTLHIPVDQEVKGDLLCITCLRAQRQEKHKYLDLSYDWNKKLSNDVFSTIRIWNPSKYWVGMEKIIRLEQNVGGGKTVMRELKRAEIVHITMRKLNEFTESECWLDTGYSRVDTVKVIKQMYDKPLVKASSRDGKGYGNCGGR